MRTPLGQLGAEELTVREALRLETERARTLVDRLREVEAELTIAQEEHGPRTVARVTLELTGEDARWLRLHLHGARAHVPSAQRIAGALDALFVQAH